jgi:hypothetical protein
MAPGLEERTFAKVEKAAVRSQLAVRAEIAAAKRELGVGRSASAASAAETTHR